jgi:penicillin-binding protein 1A
MDARSLSERLQAWRGRGRELAARGWRRGRSAAAAAVAAVRERRSVQLCLWLALATVGALALTAGAAWKTCGFAACPDAGRLAAYRPGGAPLLLDRHGQVLAKLVPEEFAEVKLRALPPYLAAAFLAIEDRRFFTHGAVDWRRAAGAFAANLRARSIEQGFSTITMQLARNLFPQEIPGSQRTMTRKLTEIHVAQQLEARFSKLDILELYLNHIYFANGAHGIEAAAWQYFGRPAARLTLAQAALLAALPKAPNRYDPRRHPDHALARRNLVLACMAAQKVITPERAAAASQEPLGVGPPPARAHGETTIAPYFVDEVRHQLEERFGGSLYDRPVRVWTTLDLGTQRAAEEELERQLQVIEAGKRGRAAKAGARAAAGGGAVGGGANDPPAAASRGLEGAVVTLSADSGDVLAWVGGRDYGVSQFDRVVNARRQAGSAWKPFVYAAALARGIALRQTIADTPLVVPLAGGATWEPRNYDGSFDGQVTLREALVHSKNVPTVRLAQAVGYDRIAELAASDGITAEVPRVPSMALGAVAVSPLEMTAAYTAFATLGWRAAPRLVLRVEGADGTTLWAAPAPARRQVLDAPVAYLLDDALREALIRGTGAPGLPAGFAGRAGGKTGTSTGGDDLWFIGFTADVVTGVWIGFDEPRPVADQATGGRLAAPVFRRLMTRLYAGRSAPAWWPVPVGIDSLPVDPESGQVLAADCIPAGGASGPRELFLAGHEPAGSCPETDSDADAAVAGGGVAPAAYASAVGAPAAYAGGDGRPMGDPRAPAGDPRGAAGDPRGLAGDPRGLVPLAAGGGAGGGAGGVIVVAPAAAAGTDRAGAAAAARRRAPKPPARAARRSIWKAGGSSPRRPMPAAPAMRAARVARAKLPARPPRAAPAAAAAPSGAIASSCTRKAAASAARGRAGRKRAGRWPPSRKTTSSWSAPSRGATCAFVMSSTGPAATTAAPCFCTWPTAARISTARSPARPARRTALRRPCGCGERHLHHSEIFTAPRRQDMQTTTANGTDTLNSLLRGEMSAIETYRQALEKVGQDAGAEQLRSIERDHRAAVDGLTTHVGRQGEKPAQDSGAWGTFAKAVTGTAKVFGNASALKALKEGEVHGVSACTRTPSTTRTCRRRSSRSCAPSSPSSGSTWRCSIELIAAS